MESVIDSVHAIGDEIFLEQGKYTLKILEDRDEEGVTCFGGEHLPHKEGV